MRHILLLLFVLGAFCAPSFGQTGAHGLMPAQDFEGILQRVQRASFDHARAPLVRQALVGHHLGSDMLRQLLEAFDYDSNRLPVAIDAYDQIADPYNYIHVADAFDYSSTRAQLLDHLAKHPISSLHCWGGGMGEQDFALILARVQKASFDSDRLPLVRQALVGGYLRADMLRRLLRAFNYDSNRLPIAIEAYRQIADPYNYLEVGDAFDYSASREQLLAHLADPAQTPARLSGGQGMTEADFARILARVEKATFDQDRIAIGRQALVGGYLRADMLRRLLRAFNYDSNRLTLARYAYPHIADPYNYAVVGDAFDYPSNAKALQDFIVGQR